MIGRRQGWRARKRAMTRVVSGAGAIVMALLLVYGLWQAIPDRKAVLALRRGEEALKRSNYAQAEKSYNTVLSLVPNSTVARLGLACVFYHSGERSAATIELTKALKAGAFAERLGRCGHGLELSDVFFVAKLGLSDAFAVPRVADAMRFRLPRPARGPRRRCLELCGERPRNGCGRRFRPGALLFLFRPPGEAPRRLCRDPQPAELCADASRAQRLF